MRRAPDLLLLLAGVFLLASVPLAGARYYDGFQLDFSHVDTLSPLQSVFLVFYGVLGTLGALLVTAGSTRLLPPARGRWTGALTNGRDRPWLVTAMVAAFAVPLVIRWTMLHGMPVTDDEGCYVFAAETLARGRLWADPPPIPLFFERQFMIAQGRWFTQYPLGWPALLAPFAATGVPWLANPVYAALTVPLAFYAAKRLVGGRGARLALLLQTLSPQLLMASATLLSHTSCLMLLCAALLLALRIRDRVAGLRDHAGLALVISLAVFVRPATGLGACLPLVVLWVSAIWRERHARLRSVVAFAVPALLMACAFLSVNALQTGSPWQIAYKTVLKHHQNLGFRFGGYPKEYVEGQSVFQPGQWDRSIALGGTALLRLNVSTFGWPACFLLLPLAWGRRGSLLPWAVLALNGAAQLPSPGVGIDVFGPMHFIETAQPVALLSAVGLLRLAAWLRRLGASGRARSAAVILLATLVTLSAVFYLPRLARRASASTSAVWTVHTAPARAGVGRAVVFAPSPIWGPCEFLPGTFAHFRPTGGPWLDHAIIWANDLGRESNQRLMAHFPGRSGWALSVNAECSVKVERIWPE
jgi:hypothetical protein